MTLEEYIELGKQGNHEAIRMLGAYYSETDENHQRDYYEAKKWHTIGAEHGYGDCMHLAASLGNLLAYARLKTSDISNGVSQEIFDELDEALHWGTEALNHSEVSVPKVKELIEITIPSSLGIAYYYASVAEFTKDEKSTLGTKYLEACISWLKPIYASATNKDALFCLAAALFKHGVLNGETTEGKAFQFSLLKKYIEEGSSTSSFYGPAAFLLGTSYAEGRGCEINYDKALLYLQKATDTGFKCDEKKAEVGKLKALKSEPTKVAAENPIKKEPRSLDKKSWFWVIISIIVAGILICGLFGVALLLLLFLYFYH